MSLRLTSSDTGSSAMKSWQKILGGISALLEKQKAYNAVAEFERNWANCFNRGNLEAVKSKLELN